jgi:hypothetical protein
VALTDAGQRYVARIGPALQEIRLASEEIHSDTGEPAGTLRLNVPNHIGTLFLDQLLIDFMIRYPKMRVETVSEARMIDIVAEGYDAGIRLEESVPQDMIAVPLTGRSASLSPPRRTILPVTAYPQTPDDLLHIRGSACVWPTAGSTAGSWRVGGNVRACRAAALCDVRSFCLDPRRKSGIRGGIFAGTLYPEELERRTGERLKRLGAAVCRAAPVLPRPSPRPARAAGAGGDDPRARDYSRLALFSP